MGKIQNSFTLRLAVPTIVTQSLKFLMSTKYFELFLFVYLHTLPSVVINRTVLEYQYRCLYIYIYIYMLVCMSVNKGKRYIRVNAFQVIKN